MYANRKAKRLKNLRFLNLITKTNHHKIRMLNDDTNDVVVEECLLTLGCEMVQLQNAAEYPTLAATFRSIPSTFFFFRLK